MLLETVEMLVICISLANERQTVILGGQNYKKENWKFAIHLGQWPSTTAKNQVHFEQ